MEEKEVVIRVRELQKQYRLGVIGYNTIQHELQSWWARKRGIQDPNTLIGQKQLKDVDCFTALEGISFDVYRGERIGVIGGNGAGKSTLFKILARVTAPTEGAIGVKGRISSMLEVGTGFHGELTGRENIYLNGAILGMQRQEIESRIDDIIEFSECETFIDTPVKRYSSGMYVKLAFAVAAHLNSEILLMDEVLAVGDMRFQKKCLQKMRELSENEKKTILYVSHNMDTIRTLCKRCIVLEKGKLIFDGETEEAIAKYLGEVVQMKLHYNYENPQNRKKITGNVQFKSLDIKKSSIVSASEGLCFQIGFQVNEKVNDLHIRFTVSNREGQVIGTSISESLGSFCKNAFAQILLRFETNMLARGEYLVELAAVEPLGQGRQRRHDWLQCAFAFGITEETFQQYQVNWSVKKWGNTVYPELKVIDREILYQKTEE